MMHNPPVPRAELDGSDRAVRIGRDRDHEASVDVTATSRDTKWFGNLEHQVGRAELPAVRELGSRGQILRIAFGGIGLDPVGNLPNLLIAQAPLVVERAEARLGLPGRHPTAFGDLGEEARPLGGVPVGQE